MDSPEQNRWKKASMPNVTPAASGQTFGQTSRPQPVNCGYLHNAFGPGCPYCRPAADSAAAGERLSDHVAEAG